jgi:dolichol kinase
MASRPLAVAMLGLTLLIALMIEMARARIRWARYHFLTSTGGLLRGPERRGLTGATYMALGYFTALLIFPLSVAVAAMLYNALGDAAAALIGRRWGGHRTAWGKSWEGAGAGFAVNTSIGLLLPGISPLAALCGGAAAAAIEFLPLPIDDNLRVTVGGGICLWLATLLAPLG